MGTFGLLICDTHVRNQMAFSCSTPCSSDSSIFELDILGVRVFFGRKFAQTSPAKPGKRNISLAVRIVSDYYYTTSRDLFGV